jgi:hypothetical protein
MLFFNALAKYNAPVSVTRFSASINVFNVYQNIKRIRDTRITNISH